MSRVSVHLVTWNNVKVLPEALDSLRIQTFKDFSLIVVDNASADGSVECVHEHFPEATLLKNFKNLGFSRGHNQAIELAKKSPHDYVLILNPDIIMEPACLERLVAALDADPEAGSACGKLLRVLPRLSEDEDPRPTDIIDSTGLMVRKSGRMLDRGSGEKDTNQYDASTEVFGAPGAFALHRWQALEVAAAMTGEVFDEDFFTYKEDIDLAWRLQLAGWKTLYLPTAQAYHYRGTAGAERASLSKSLGGRLKRSPTVNRLSARNHLWILIKNLQMKNALLYLPMIGGYEIAKFFAVLFTHPSVLPAYVSFWQHLPKMLKKRRAIMKQTQRSAADMRKWLQ